MTCLILSNQKLPVTTRIREAHYILYTTAFGIVAFTEGRFFDLKRTHNCDQILQGVVHDFQLSIKQNSFLKTEISLQKRILTSTLKKKVRIYVGINGGIKSEKYR